jgi:hypothetical protein
VIPDWLSEFAEAQQPRAGSLGAISRIALGLRRSRKDRAGVRFAWPRWRLVLRWCRGLLLLRQRELELVGRHTLGDVTPKADLQPADRLAQLLVVRFEHVDRLLQLRSASFRRIEISELALKCLHPPWQLLDDRRVLRRRLCPGFDVAQDECTGEGRGGSSSWAGSGALRGRRQRGLACRTYMLRCSCHAPHHQQDWRCTSTQRTSSATGSPTWMRC